jgi:SH3-like domain-containing protein
MQGSGRGIAAWTMVLAALAPALADPAPPAHFASLRQDKVYLREGPTAQYRVLWVYRRKDYPVEVIASYDGWQRVRDMDGTVGWISATMLSEARTIVVTGKGRAAIRAAPDGTSPALAFAEPGVVARLKACKPAACRVTADGTDGWIDKKRIWGVSAGEVFP